MNTTSTETTAEYESDELNAWYLDTALGLSIDQVTQLNEEMRRHRLFERHLTRVRKTPIGVEQLDVDDVLL